MTTDITCFICLTTVPTAEDEARSLAPLLQFLDKDPAVEDLGILAGIKVPDDLSVLMCQDCARLALRLTKFCEGLEKIKRKLVENLREFYGKMEERRMPLNSQEGIWRERTKEICALKLGLQPEPEVVTAPGLEVGQSLFQNFTLPVFPAIRQNNLVTCGACPKEAKSTFETESFFRRHFTCCHLDSIFGPLKLSRFNQEQFKVYCEYLLTQEMRFCGYEDENVTRDDGDNNPGFTCYYCQVKYCLGKTMVTHLVTEHTNQLARNLLKLQNNWRLVDFEEMMGQPRSKLFQEEEEVTMEEPSASGPRQIFNCPQCERGYLTKSGMNVHFKRIHLGMVHLGKVLCQDCGKWFSQSYMKKHKAFTCKKEGEGGSPEQGSSSSSGTAEDEQVFYLNENIRVEMVDPLSMEEDSGAIWSSSSSGSLSQGEQGQT